ncbi:MAG: hypothetical protein J6Z07_06510 [Lachnospiraceae bacterium]|nr:hypothetical protein [Lachnospiraceae bacterium]MBP5564443.1 hypothetical protein [Lachnospiraceae bacterium]
MIFPVFASVIVFCIWLAYEIRKSNKRGEKAEKAFWDKEAEADNTRKMPLDDLHYIVIPDEIFKPFLKENGEFIETDESTEKVLFDAVTAFKHLKNSKIVNFSNITNTDLKLTYGAANLPELTLYDQNFVLLMRTLQSMGEYFHAAGDKETSKLMLEFAVSSGSDSIGTFKLLSSIYIDEQDFSKINYLISSASLLTGLTKGPILKHLHEIAPSDKENEESILDILD